MRELKAKDIMNRGILAVRDDWSVERVAEFFIEHSISGAPVTTDQGTLIGVVTLTDLVLHSTLPVKDPYSGSPNEYYLDALGRNYSAAEIASFHIAGEPLSTVRDIMTPTLYKVPEDASLRQVADLMLKNAIHRVFVTSGDQVVGIIATPDMLKAIRDA